MSVTWVSGCGYMECLCILFSVFYFKLTYKVIIRTVCTWISDNSEPWMWIRSHGVNSCHTHRLCTWALKHYAIMSMISCRCCQDASSSITDQCLILWGVWNMFVAGLLEELVVWSILFIISKWHCREMSSLWFYPHRRHTHSQCSEWSAYLAWDLLYLTFTHLAAKSHLQSNWAD